MGDEIEQYTIQVKGTAYRFRPIPQDDIAMILTVINMGASQTKTLKALGRVLGDSAGPEQWDAISDRLISGEIKPGDLSGIFKKVMERQSDASKPVKKTGPRKRPVSSVDAQ